VELARHGPGQFAGELNMLTGQRPFLTAWAATGGCVLALTPAQLREVLARETDVADLLLRALIARRRRHVSGAVPGAAIEIIGSSQSGPALALALALALRTFLNRNTIAYQWVDVDQADQADQAAGAALRRAAGQPVPRRQPGRGGGRKLHRRPGRRHLGIRRVRRGRIRADRRRRAGQAGRGPLASRPFIGGGIALLGTASGGSENPARQFGPAIASGQTRFLWAYLLAPVLAAVLAAAARRAIHPARQVMTHRLCGPGARPHGQAQPGHRSSQDGSEAGR
jgi:hypothetical protein